MYSLSLITQIDQVTTSHLAQDTSQPSDNQVPDAGNQTLECWPSLSHMSQV